MKTNKEKVSQMNNKFVASLSELRNSTMRNINELLDVYGTIRVPECFWPMLMHTDDATPSTMWCEKVEGGVHVDGFWVIPMSVSRNDQSFMYPYKIDGNVYYKEVRDMVHEVVTDDYRVVLEFLDWYFNTMSPYIDDLKKRLGKCEPNKAGLVIYNWCKKNAYNYKYADTNEIVEWYKNNK